MPTYEELLAQISALKKQVKYLGNQTEKAEKKYEQAQSEIKNITRQTIAKWIIDAHSGTIQVVSRPEIGTRFIVRFPMCE